MEELESFRVDRSRLSKCLFSRGPGLQYRRSGDITDVKSRAVAPWDSVVWGKREKNGLLKVGNCHLPMLVNDVPVLARTSAVVTSDGITAEDSNVLAFRVNSGKAEEPAAWRPGQKGNTSAYGLSYRKSQKIEDLDGNMVAPWNSLVFGILKEGFLKVGQRYLPTHLNGECVLVQQGTSEMPGTSGKVDNSSVAPDEIPSGITEDVGIIGSVVPEENAPTYESEVTNLSEISGQELPSDISTLALRVEKLKSTFEADLASIEEKLSSVTERYIALEEPLSGLKNMELRLLDHEKRLASCEDQFGHLPDTKHVETELRQVQSEVAAERSERMLHVSELHSFKEQLMPRLQACEAELSKKVSGADLLKELLRIKENGSMQLTTQRQESSEDLSGVKMHDLQAHLEKISRDFEARLAAHAQDIDARLATYRDAHFIQEVPIPKSNSLEFSSSSHAVGTNLHLANDDCHPSNFAGQTPVEAGLPQIPIINQGQRLSIDEGQPDFAQVGSSQDMYATFWASEKEQKAPLAQQTDATTSPQLINSVSSPELHQNPTAGRPQRASASPFKQRIIRTSSAGLNHGLAQATPLSNPPRSLTPQPYRPQRLSVGAVYVQSGTPRSHSPQPFAASEFHDSRRRFGVLVTPGTKMS